MASKVDMSLDDLVKKGGRKRSGGPTAKRLQNIKSTQGGKGPLGKRTSGGTPPNKFGNKQQGGKGAETKVADLRDVLAMKQSANVTDLRSKLKPKALYTSKNIKSAPGTPTSPSKPRRSGGITKTILSPPPVQAAEPQRRRSRRSDPGPQLRHRDTRNSVSYEEAKKITVTVPGSSRPVSETQYTPHHGREERLAAAIARSKELRQDSYLRGREEVIASAITSAFGDGGGGGAGGSGHHHHDRGLGGVQRMPLQVYSRSPSPSPVPDFNYDTQFSIPPPRAPFQPKTTRGITTLTSMLISNLSDTVSKNDISELCSAVGPLETVTMPAPGMVEVVFKFKDDALEAFKKYNQRNLDGQPMVCKLQPASRTRLTGAFGYAQGYAGDIYGTTSGFY